MDILAKIERGELVVTVEKFPSYDRTKEEETELLRLARLGAAAEKAMDIAVQYGGIDGAHHKDWVIDQMVRVLAGEKYEQIIRDACNGEDGPNTYEWDCGIAP